MKRPALTWKAIKNLEDLWGFAEGEMQNYDYDEVSPSTKGAREAIEWIKKCRQWKREQEATK